MNILIKSATIIDASSPFNNKTQDILVEKGVIRKIADSIQNPKNYKEIVLENLHISPGWFDSSVCFGEPGYEERETITNGLQTAAQSGFTAVGVNSNTDPVIDNSSGVTFLLKKATNHATTIIPIGALTKKSESKSLGELYDMHNAGAKAFYDYKKAITNANLMKIALQYAGNFNGLVCSYPQNNSIAGNGVVNEHITSTQLGLRGNPNVAEELQITRDLFLLEYTGGKLHIPTISTAKSVDLIKQAKQKGLDVSCSVAIHNLWFTDEVLSNFDTNFKVLPPLRTKADVNALIKGLKDGTIDMVTSDHNPLNIEEKKVEFDHAAYGSIGLESAFGVLQSIFTLKQTIAFLTQGKTRFGVPSQSITVNNPINITLFNPKTTYTFSTKNILSKSKNSMFINETLKGIVYGVLANGKIILK